MSRSHPKPKLPRDRPWQQRGWLAVWIFIGLAIPISYLAWPYVGSPRPIVVSRETTYLTDPALITGGLIDYYSVLAADLREAGVTSTSEDAWMKEAAPNPPWVNWELTGPTTYRSSPQLRQLTDQNLKDESARWTAEDKILLGEFLRLHPWNSDSHPTLAQMIAGNAEWYAKAQRKFVPYSPIDIKDPTASSPPLGAGAIFPVAHDVESVFLDRFALRAAFRWGSGNVDLAIEDVKFALEIANRHQYDRYAVARGMQWESRVFTLVANCLLESADINPDALVKIADLPTASTRPQFKYFVKNGRLHALDFMQRNSMGYSDLFFIVDPTSRLKLMHERRLRINTDWNEVMRATNRFFDQIEAAITITNSAEALRIINSRRKRPVGATPVQRLQKRNLLQSVPITQEVIAAFNYGQHRRYGDDFIYTLHRDLQRQIVQIIAGLVAWKHEHGQFPDSLDQLASSAAPFKVKPDFLIDPFSGTQLSYNGSQEGFELRSVGGNQKQDEQVFQQIGLSRRSPPFYDQDPIWRWPISSAVAK